MSKLKTLIKESEIYINSEKILEWEKFCYSLFEEMREIGVEVIEDSIKTMSLLECQLELNYVAEKVGRSWGDGVSYFLLTNIVGFFYKESEKFKKQLFEREKQNNKTQDIDEFMKKIR